MKRIDLLKRRQAQLKAEIAASLDILIGTLAKSPAMTRYGLMTKEGGKTKSRSVRKELVGPVRDMTRRYAKLKRLIKSLSKVNWEILDLENK